MFELMYNYFMFTNVIHPWLTDFPAWLQTWNTFAWVTANLLIAYIAIVLIVFVIGYYALFDPKATTAGKNIFRFAFSLIGVIGLVCIGIFLDPAKDREWFNYSGDVLWWRPTVRLIVYGYVAYSITALAVLLVIRKWWPDKLRTSLDKALVQTRHEPKTDTIDLPQN